MYVTVLCGYALCIQLHMCIRTVLMCIRTVLMYVRMHTVCTHIIYYTHATYVHTYIYVLQIMCEYVCTYVCIIFFQMKNMLWSLYPAMYLKMPGLICTVLGRMSFVPLQHLCWTVSNNATPALSLCSETASYSPGGCIL